MLIFRGAFLPELVRDAFLKQNAAGRTLRSPVQRRYFRLCRLCKISYLCEGFELFCMLRRRKPSKTLIGKSQSSKERSSYPGSLYTWLHANVVARLEWHSKGKDRQEHAAWSIGKETGSWKWTFLPTAAVSWFPQTIDHCRGRFQMVPELAESGSSWFLLLSYASSLA